MKIFFRCREGGPAVYSTHLFGRLRGDIQDDSANPKLKVIAMGHYRASESPGEAKGRHHCGPRPELKSAAALGWSFTASRALEVKSAGGDVDMEFLKVRLTARRAILRTSPKNHYVANRSTEAARRQ